MPISEKETQHITSNPAKFGFFLGALYGANTAYQEILKDHKFANNIPMARKAAGLAGFFYGTLGAVFFSAGAKVAISTMGSSNISKNQKSITDEIAALPLPSLKK